MSTTRSNNHQSRCSFTFADGRQCRMPRQSGHLFLCCFHARREAQAHAAEEVGRDIRFFLSGDYLSAGDLSLALGRVFAATARGDLKPKTAGTLAYLGQTLLQTIHHAENEYINAFRTDRWRRVIHSHVNENSHYLFPPPPPAEAPLPAAPPVPALTPAAAQVPAQPAQQQLPPQPPGPDQSHASVEAGLQPGTSYRGRPSASQIPLASPRPQLVAPPANPQPIATGQPSAVEEAGNARLYVNDLVGAQHRCALPASPGKTPRGSSVQNSDLRAGASTSSAPSRLPRNAAQFAATILASTRSSANPSRPLATGQRRVSVEAGLQPGSSFPAPSQPTRSSPAALPDSPPCSAGFTPASSPESPAAPTNTRQSGVASSAPPSTATPNPAAALPTGPSSLPVLVAPPPRNSVPQPARPSDSSPSQTAKPIAAPPTNNSSGPKIASDPASSQPSPHPTQPSDLPGFGSPANWDVLIPQTRGPARRRRQIRPWHLPE